MLESWLHRLYQQKEETQPRQRRYWLGKRASPQRLVAEGMTGKSRVKFDGLSSPHPPFLADRTLE